MEKTEIIDIETFIFAVFCCGFAGNFIGMLTVAMIKAFGYASIANLF